MFSNKRLRIVLSNIVLCSILWSLGVVDRRWQGLLVVIVAISSYLLTSWSFRQYLYGIKLINLFVLPVYLTTAAAVFLVQFDLDFRIKILLLVSFLAINYVITLAENIFNVSQVRNIPLLRAAHTVGYLSTLGVSYLTFFLIYNAHLNLALTGLCVLVFSFPLYLQAFWQIDLEEKLSAQIFLSSMIATVATAQIGFIIGFWPLVPIGAGLALTTSVYTFLGLVQYQIRGNLHRRAILEYVFMGLSVFTLLLTTMQW